MYEGVRTARHAHVGDASDKRLLAQVKEERHMPRWWQGFPFDARRGVMASGLNDDVVIEECRKLLAILRYSAIEQHKANRPSTYGRMGQQHGHARLQRHRERERERERANIQSPGVL